MHYCQYSISLIQYVDKISRRCELLVFRFSCSQRNRRWCTTQMNYSFSGHVRTSTLHVSMWSVILVDYVNVKCFLATSHVSHEREVLPLLSSQMRVCVTFSELRLRYSMMIIHWQTHAWLLTLLHYHIFIFCRGIELTLCSNERLIWIRAKINVWHV